MNTKLIYTFALIGISTYTSAQNTGINTVSPTNSLHVAPTKEGENPIRVEGLNESNSTKDKVIVADENGVLKTKSSRANADELLVNESRFTPDNQTIVLSGRKNDRYKETLLKSATFTLDREAIVTTEFNLSYNIEGKERNQWGALSDGYIRTVQAFIQYSDTDTNEYAYVTKEIEGTKQNEETIGLFALSSSHTRKMKPGTYTITLYGSLGGPAQNRSTGVGIHPTKLTWDNEVNSFQVNAIYTN